MIPPSPVHPAQQSAYDAGRWDDAHGIYTELRCLLEPEMRGADEKVLRPLLAGSEDLVGSKQPMAGYMGTGARLLPP